jgi:hypothetical protein
MGLKAANRKKSPQCGLILFYSIIYKRAATEKTDTVKKTENVSKIN